MYKIDIYPRGQPLRCFPQSLPYGGRRPAHYLPGKEIQKSPSLLIGKGVRLQDPAPDLKGEAVHGYVAPVRHGEGPVDHGHGLLRVPSFEIKGSRVSAEGSDPQALALGLSVRKGGLYGRSPPFDPALHPLFAALPFKAGGGCDGKEGGVLADVGHEVRVG